MNNKGNLMNLPVNLLILFICITFLVALIPGFVAIVGMSQGPDSLNCHGYRVYDATTGAIDWTNSANDSRPQNDIGCIAMKLTLPYIILGVLIAGVAGILYGRSLISSAPDQAMYG